MALYPDKRLYPGSNVYPGETLALGLTATAEEFYSELEPAVTDDAHEMADLVSGFAKPFEQVYDLANGGPEGYSPWAVIFDADDAPAWALPYLANFAGVPVVEGWTEADLRYAIKNRPQLVRGTPDAIKAALLPYLTGTKRIFLKERTPTPYEYRIYSLASETTDETRARAALKRAKPARLQFEYEALEGPTWGMVADTFDSWADLKAAEPSWQALQFDEALVG